MPEGLAKAVTYVTSFERASLSCNHEETNCPVRACMENFWLLHKSPFVLDAAHSAFLKGAPNLDSPVLQTISETYSQARALFSLPGRSGSEAAQPTHTNQVRCYGCWTYEHRTCEFKRQSMGYSS